ncbi:MAG: outer membrane protein assembly factor BamD [Candidatus Omnitrophota bacterium]
MKLKNVLLYSIAISLLLTTSIAHAYWIWTPQSKKWINPKYAPKETPKEQLNYALDFFEAADYKKALPEFFKVIKHYKKSEAASEAQYYIGRCYEEMNKPYEGFLSYQKVIDNYPFTNRLDEIIKRQFDIGERLSRGEEIKFFGVGFKAWPEKIVEVYKKVVANAPYSRYAPQAQFRIGELYKQLEFYDEARDAFQKIVEDYPDSELSPEAKFQVAICASNASGKSGYDQKLTKVAIEEFEEFAKAYPDSDLVKKAEEEKRVLSSKRVDSYLKIAKFYERSGKIESAILYYNKVVEESPDSEVAAQAFERIKILEKKHSLK